jgi:hypothetical protein
MKEQMGRMDKDKMCFLRVVAGFKLMEHKCNEDV